MKIIKKIVKKITIKIKNKTYIYNNKIKMMKNQRK